MIAPSSLEPPVAPVDVTLTRVVVLMRLLGGIWLLIIAVVVLATSSQNQDLNVAMVVVAMVVGAAGTLLTLFAARRGFLDHPSYVWLDVAITLFLAFAGWLAAHNGFIVGGYPASTLFVIAFATNLRITVVAGLVGTATMGVLHQLMDLEATRAFGSVQYLIVAAVVGWAFDSLRQRERLRIVAEQERSQAERQLSEERLRSGRLEERSALARRLHDSVLQTLKLISSSAEDPAEVRYLARVQERDLRRTINEYQSPYDDSFRARLLDARASVEDRFRVEIEQVVTDDAEMDDRLEAVVAATTEALTNAARHSGVQQIDLFGEIRDGVVVVSVRDRGVGFSMTQRGTGIDESIIGRMTGVDGHAEVKTSPGNGTQVMIELPLR